MSIDFLSFLHTHESIKRIKPRCEGIDGLCVQRQLKQKFSCGIQEEEKKEIQKGQKIYNSVINENG